MRLTSKVREKGSEGKKEGKRGDIVQSKKFLRICPGPHF